MKKHFKVLIIASLLLCILTGCNHSKGYDGEGVRDVWDLTMSLNSIDTNNKIISVDFIKGNQELDGELITGESYEIYKLSENTDEFKKLEPINEACFNDEALMIKNGETTTVEHNYEYLYGHLYPGRYEIKKKVLLVKEPGNFQEATYGATFVIKNPER